MTGFDNIWLPKNRTGAPLSGLDPKIQRQKKLNVFNALKRCFKSLIFDWNLK
jgi:hypothetical protein